MDSLLPPESAVTHRSFRVSAKSGDYRASGFRGDPSSFVSLHIGDTHTGAFSIIFRTLDEARSVGRALIAAADFADGARVMSIADLGLEDPS